MITIDSLTKTYGRKTVVDDISFAARSGRVTGFLGPNGAGKSTSMRMMVGLTTPTAGSATILGRRFADLPNPGAEVGVMLDASAQHAGRTGREILTLAQRMMGLSSRRVDESIEEVGLTEAEANQRVGSYSLGMRQRLGVATALIGEPAVLILDEPANGLDPAGIRWMRDLLRGYADQGGTVLLSSHLLREVDNHGVRTTGTDDGALRADADPARVGRAALTSGLALTELRTADGGLEDMFLQLTADTQRERKAA